MKISQSIINRLFWGTWILCVVLTVIMFNLAMKETKHVHEKTSIVSNSDNLTPMQWDAMNLAANTLTEVSQALEKNNYYLACTKQTEIVELLITADQYSTAYQALMLQDKICSVTKKSII